MNGSSSRRRWVLALGGLGLLGAAMIASVVIAFGQGEERPTGVHRVGPIPPRTASTVLKMPADADCAGCHVIDDGTIGLAPIPAIAHPVDGWRRCTACHSAERLVTPAPGHDGIDSVACLSCHTVETPAGPPRPHGMDRNQGCLECHETERVHVPESMLDRPDEFCWLCHQATETGWTPGG